MRVGVRFCCAVLLLGAGTVGFGQQVGPKALDRSFQRPGARALGMGGAYLLATDDATAVAWNPAALANIKRFTIPIEVAGRAKNFRVQDVRDLVDDLEKLRDSIANDDIAGAKSAYDEVQGFLQRHGAAPGGGPTTIGGSLAPVAGLSLGSFGLTFSSGIVGQIQGWTNQPADPGTGIGAFADANNIYSVGGAIAVSSVGIAHARLYPAGLTLGASVRLVRADFAAFRVGAAGTVPPVDPNPIRGTVFDEVDRTRFTLDVGALWEPPVQLPMVKVRYGAVVRNLLPVRFNLPVVAPTNDPAALPLPADFNFRLNPEIDAGVMATWRERTIGVLELHNLTSSNGGDMSIHAGVEHWLGKVFAVRAGYDDDRPVVGIGINLGVLRIDAASGFKPRERLAVGISLRF